MAQPKPWCYAPNNNRWFKFQAQSDSVDVTVHAGTVEFAMAAIWDAGEGKYSL